MDYTIWINKRKRILHSSKYLWGESLEVRSSDSIRAEYLSASLRLSSSCDSIRFDSDPIHRISNKAKQKSGYERCVMWWKWVPGHGAWRMRCVECRRFPRRAISLHRRSPLLSFLYGLGAIGSDLSDRSVTTKVWGCGFKPSTVELNLRRRLLTRVSSSYIIKNHDEWMWWTRKKKGLHSTTELHVKCKISDLIVFFYQSDLLVGWHMLLSNCLNTKKLH